MSNFSNKKNPKSGCEPTCPQHAVVNWIIHHFVALPAPWAPCEPRGLTHHKWQGRRLQLRFFRVTTGNLMPQACAVPWKSVCPATVQGRAFGRTHFPRPSGQPVTLREHSESVGVGHSARNPGNSVCPPAGLGGKACSPSCTLRHLFLSHPHPQPPKGSGLPENKSQERRHLSFIFLFVPLGVGMGNFGKTI